MADLSELIERVEAAQGADRGIDCWIENHLGLARFVDDRPDPHSDSWLQKRVDPKPYTASLDAAMSLVPEGMGWGIISLESTKGFVGIHVGRAATPALALVAAALKARAIQEKS